MQDFQVRQAIGGTSMDASAATDVDRTVEYGRERYWMNRVPLALLGCIAGLFMLAMDPGPPGLAPLLLLGALLVAGAAAAIATFAMNHAIDQLKPVWSVGFVLALALGAVVWFVGEPRYRRTSLLDPSFGMLGWMFVFFSLGFIAFALGKHLRPAPPMLALSPEGLKLHYSWLKDLLIPWVQVEHVGQLEHVLPGGTVSRHPESLVVVMSQDFYERHILPRRTFLSGSLWSGMFQPRGTQGAQMQMLLPYPWFSIPLKDMQEPVEARWKAFREQEADAPSQAPTEPPLRLSAWSHKTMTLWRQILFAVPMAGVLLMLTHFGGLWDTAFLRTAREDFAQKTRRLEEQRQESQRIKDMLKRSNEAAEERRQKSEQFERDMNRVMTK
jgi:hypothetical protein